MPEPNSQATTTQALDKNFSLPEMVKAYKEFNELFEIDKYGYGTLGLKSLIVKYMTEPMSLTGREKITMALIGCDLYQQVGYPMASENLRLFLKGTHSGIKRVDESILLNNQQFQKKVVGEHWDVIKVGIKKRLRSQDGQLFPDKDYFQEIGPDETYFDIIRAESMLKNGREETLYLNQDVTFNSSSNGDFYFSYGAIRVTSKVKVKASFNDESQSWEVYILKWEFWAYDHYDWNEGVGVEIPVPSILQKYFGKQISIKDEFFKSINNLDAPVKLKNGDFYHPSSYRVIFSGVVDLPLEIITSELGRYGNTIQPYIVNISE